MPSGDTDEIINILEQWKHDDRTDLDSHKSISPIIIYLLCFIVF